MERLLSPLAKGHEKQTIRPGLNHKGMTALRRLTLQSQQLYGKARTLQMEKKIKQQQQRRFKIPKRQQQQNKQLKPQQQQPY